jgi:enoyl-CoA hydratase/carnithine racemase
LATIQQAGEIASYRESDDVPQAEPGAPLAEDFRFGYGYIMSLRKPVVVAVNGACAGLGFSPAMFCDLRFASESAIFTTQFAQRGLVAEHGMGWVLSRLIGPSRALDVLWSGRRLSANEALDLGLINRVVAPEDLLGEAQGYIEQLASTASPKALMQMKSQVYRYLNQPLGTAMADTGQLQDISVKWPDLQEGIASFVERRPPQFSRLSKAEPQWGRDE